MAEDLCSAEVVRFRFLGTPFASRTIAGLAEEFGARLMTDHFLYCFKVVNEEMAGNENHRDTATDHSPVLESTQTGTGNCRVIPKHPQVTVTSSLPSHGVSALRSTRASP